MASRAILELLIEAIDKASGVLEKVEGKGTALGKAWQASSTLIAGASLAAGGAVAGFAAIAIKSAAEDEAASARMSKALENLSNTVGASDAEWERWTAGVDEAIAAGQRKAFSDDEIRNSLQTLIAATGSYDEAQQRLSAAQDLARGKNISLEQASTLLAKANEENVNVLRRMGIVLGENATEADLLAAVQQRFAGQAEEYGRSTSGQFEQAKIQLGELTESAGSLLLPMVTRLATEGVALLEKFSGWFEANRPQIESALSAVGSAFTTMTGYFMTGLQTIYPLLETVVRFLLDNQPLLIAALVAIGIAVTASFGPVGVAVVAIGGFITLLGYLRDHWQEVLASVIGFIEEHAGMISAIFGPAGTLLVLFVQFRDTLGTIFEWIKRAIGVVADAFEAVYRRVSSAMSSIASAVESAYNRIKPMIDFIRGGVAAVGSAVPNFLSGVPGFASGTQYAPGGVALVGEGGPELVDLPAGARVFPASRTRGMLGGGGTTVVINITQPLGTPAAIAAAVADALAYNSRRGRATA